MRRFFHALASLSLLGGSLWFVLSFQACGAACRTSIDCTGGKICKAGSCVRPETANEQTLPDQPPSDQPPSDQPPSDQPPSDQPPSDQPPSDQPPSDQPPSDQPPTEIKPEGPPPPPKPQAGEVVINEVLFDPPEGTAGDANQDGKRDPAEDDFVEVVNTTTQVLDLSGAFLEDATQKRLFTFPLGAFLPGRTAAVIFGGGMTSDTKVGKNVPHEKFGGAFLYKSSALGLTTSAKKIILRGGNNVLLSEFEYGQDASCPAGTSLDQSLNRSPELTGICAKHKDLSSTQALFSPGLRVDGRLFSDPDPEPKPEPRPEPQAEKPADSLPDGGEMQAEATPETPAEPTPEPQPEIPAPPAPQAGEVVINEILFDPPTDAVAGDANKDGRRDAAEDDFIEVVNTTAQALNLSGCTLEDVAGSQKFFTFPQGAFLPAKGVAVIFGGGMTGDGNVGSNKPHPTKFSGAYVYKFSLAGGLTGTARKIALKSAAGVILNEFEYGQDPVNCPAGTSLDQSLNRSPEMTGACAKHSTLSTGQPPLLFSPGTKADGSAF